MGKCPRWTETRGEFEGSLSALPMRLLLLLSLYYVAATVQAQSPLFPDGTAATRAAPHWRIGLSGGFADGVGTGTGSLSAERSLAKMFAVGARAAIYTGDGLQDDGPSFEGVSLEALASVGTRDRVLDLRALAGVGAAIVNYDPGFCDYETDSSCPEPEQSGLLPSPLVFVGAGLDLYVTPTVGLGVEARLARRYDEVNFSSVEAGLRVRLAR